MKRYYLLFLPLLGLLFSYQSPDYQSQTEINAAQAWYQNSDYANTIFMGQSLQPDWSGATVSKPKNDRLIIDVPLVNGDQFDLALKDRVTGQTNPADKNGAARLVITKFADNHYIPLIFFAFGTPSFVNQYGLQAAGLNKPHQVQANFTGYMVYLKLDETPFSGLYVENGQVKATLTGVEKNSIIPRNCSLLSTICAFYNEGWLCVNYVLCEVYDDSGVYTYNVFTNNWWWNGGPMEDCYGCLGGGYAPPICPNGSLMPEDGQCQAIEQGPSSECILTNLFVTSPGPFVIEPAILGMIPFPWEAYSDVVGKLTNCQNGDAEYNLAITNSTGEVTIGDSYIYSIDKKNFPPAKIWGITTKSYAQFIFTIEVTGFTFTSIANGNADSYLSFKYK